MDARGKQLEFEELTLGKQWQQRAPDRLERLLSYAVVSRNVAQIRALLKAGADINHRRTSYRGIGSTFLHCAIGRGYTDSVQALLEARPNLHAVDDIQLTACQFAFFMGYKGIVQLFPADIIHEHIVVCLFDNILTADELMHFWIADGGKNSTGGTADDRLSNALVVAKRTSLFLGSPLLHFMVIFCREANDLKNFLDTEAPDTNALDHDSLTALHWAIRCNNLEAAKVLLSHGAKVSIVDPSGLTTIGMAVRKRSMEMVLLLAETCQEPSYFHDALHEAAVTGFAEAIPVLCDRQELDINFRPFAPYAEPAGDTLIGHTLLSIAIHYGSNKSMLALLEHGADPNCVVNEYNVSILHLALQETIDVCQLLNYKPDVNVIEDSTGGTALHRFARWNRLESALALVHAGADVNIKDRQGRTPFQVAATEGLTRFCSTFQEASHTLRHLCLLAVRRLLPADVHPDSLTARPMPFLLKRQLIQIL